tara:strand:+ start:1620 stop:2387 length:768 start_codon:yes stop_codon:yes gene_type:complete
METKTRMRWPLSGEVIYRTEDALGDILVIDKGKHRVLSFGSIFEQSKIDPARPYLPVHEYNRAMLLPLAFARPQHATVLGLGGGSLVNALYHLLPEATVSVVELRSEVVDVARRFFGLATSPRISITIEDVRRAMPRLPEGATDLILTDLYDAQRMSPVQTQRRFIDQCARALSTEGWLAINYHELPPENGPLFMHLRALFAVVLLFKSKTGNYVLYACKECFDPMGSDDPRLSELEEKLPLGWRRLMGRVMRVV